MLDDIPPLFEWDPEKDRKNQEKHKLPLTAAVNFDFSTANIFQDARRDYGERRYNAYGFDTEGHAMCLCFTFRECIRFISYRPMNSRERKKFLTELE